MSEKEPCEIFKGELREYQKVGLHWLYQLNSSNLNGMLADEMGLGKTIQTIALLSSLAVENGNWGPHLVIAPSSVVTNWEMEFKRFCPGLSTISYLGSKQKRAELRKGIWRKNFGFNVCITSYSIALKDERIFKMKSWSYLILDEAHQIKNSKSQRFENLHSIAKSCQFRLLLTGTPLQNSLEELWSLLNFMMPLTFAEMTGFNQFFNKPVKDIIEEYKLSGKRSNEAVKKLHSILKPFLLRRLKSSVATQLPQKHEHLVECSLSKRQRELYQEFLQRKDTQNRLMNGTFVSVLGCLMNLRKVCNHPDLFTEREVKMPFFMAHPDLSKVCKIAKRFAVDDLNLDVGKLPVHKQVSKVAGFIKNPEVFERIFSDRVKIFLRKRMKQKKSVQKNIHQKLDFTPGLKFLQFIKHESQLDEMKKLKDDLLTYTFQRHFDVFIDRCQSFVDYKSYSCELKPVFSRKTSPIDLPRKKLPLLFPESRLIQYDCGKLQKLESMLRNFKANSNRCLIFSQMSKMIDILEKFMSYHGFTYLRLDGKIKPEERLSIMERFNHDKKIFCLLLSTRAGGLGVNLIGADTVIFYDSDWNPTVDAQAQDRCHRIGQTKEVNVYRMVCKDTVEERILETANSKRNWTRIF